MKSSPRHITTASPSPGRKVALFVLLSLFGSACWCKVLSVDGSLGIANSITGLVVFGVVSAILRSGFSSLGDMPRRHLVVASVFSVALSLAVTLGWRIQSSGVHDDLSAYGSASLTSPITYAVLFGILLTILPAVSLLLRHTANRKSLSHADERMDASGSLPSSWHGSRSYVVYLLVIFCCWIPVLLFFFPGINGYDFIFQANQFLSGSIDGHHPVVHTLLLGMFLQAGFAVGEVWIGILLYTVFQMVVMAAIFAYAVHCVALLSHRRALTLFALGWFALCPINSVLAISTTKDTLFCGFVILSISLLISIFARGRSLGKVIGLALSILMALLFRNNAVVAFGLLVLVGLVSQLARRRLPARWTVAVAALPLVLYLVIVGPIYSLAGVLPSDTISESLSVPLQQLARTAVLADDLNDEDRVLIDRLIPEWPSYQAGISDLVKNTMDEDYLKDNLAHIAWRYVAIGLSHPLIYVESFLINTYAYWYPDVPAFDRGGFMYHPYLEVPSNMDILDPETYIVIEHHNLLPAAGSLYEDMLIKHGWESIPLLASLMNAGFIIWPYLLALAIRLSLGRRGDVLTLPFAFLALYWLTCLLGPCALVRYIYPLFAALPFVVSDFATRLGLCSKTGSTLMENKATKNRLP